MADDTQPGPHPALEQFKSALRALRIDAGNPPYREMTRTTGFGRTVLSQALNGRTVPTWPVVEALVSTFGASVREWRTRWSATVNAVQAQAPPENAVPRQLPADINHFVGRRAELERLNSHLAELRGNGDSVGIVSISGIPGVGKTALAVHWARQQADQFPDGQLYVDLRGFGGSSTLLEPGDVIRGFLTAFGLSETPPTEAEQKALYLSVMAEKRILIVLDNARDSNQVRQLIPGAPGCLILITSRATLTGLVARDHATHIKLTPFSDDEAHELLVHMLGSRRVADGGSPAARELVELCARLPLAVSIVAARAVTDPALSIGVLVGQLRAEHRRLDALITGDGSDTDLPAVFSWSYRALSLDAARLFRLLGLSTGPDISVSAVASLAALRVPDAEFRLSELSRANLVEHRAVDRFQIHDLLRVYARRLTEATDSEPVRKAAIRRLLDHYLHTANRGALELLPHGDPIPVGRPQPDVVTYRLAGTEQALAWFARERRTLLAAIAQAAEHRLDEQCWQLVEACSDFLDRQGHWQDWLKGLNHALSAARRSADRYGQARVHRDLGLACTRLGRLDEAVDHFMSAVSLFDALGDNVGVARAQVHLSWVFESRGQFRDALDHAERALDLFAHAAHPVGQATALDTAANHHLLLGDYRQALARSKAALELFQDMSDPYGEASAWDNMGSAYRHLGEHARALVCFDRALRLCQDAADRYGASVILTHLGDTHRQLEDFAAARDTWNAALDILDDLGHLDAVRLRERLKGLRLP